MAIHRSVHRHFQIGGINLALAVVRRTLTFGIDHPLDGDEDFIGLSSPDWALPAVAYTHVHRVRSD